MKFQVQQVDAQQQQQQDGQQPQTLAKTRVVKVRRSRQSRNPQLSVARRNERERNRVKMVNNGFAMLRDHLPAEYLQAADLAGRDSPASCADPDTPRKMSSKRSSSSSSSASASASAAAAAAAKKFSKVETLRAAIQHIRMLEQLIRSAEPDFESINIQAPSRAISDDSSLDGAPLSCGQAPSSCAWNSILSPGAAFAHSQQQQQHQSYQMYEGQTSEQFVKLEPHVQQIQPQQFGTTHLEPMAQLKEEGNEQQSNEHTHLWIQQHQTSFEQQQQQQQQQQHLQQQHQDLTFQTDQTQWFQNSFAQHQQQLVAEQQLSPISLDSPAGQQMQAHPQQQQQQQHNQPWFVPSGDSSSPSPQSSQLMQQQQQQQQYLDINQLNHQTSQQMEQLMAFNQHQISLYSR